MVRGDIELIVIIKHRDRPDDAGVASMQQADQLTHGIPIVPGHAVFAGDRQRFDDVSPGIDHLALQFVVAVHHKK